MRYHIKRRRKKVCIKFNEGRSVIDSMAYMPYNERVKMTEFEVIFYEKEDGEIPIEIFLLSLTVKMRAKLVGMIGILQQFGNQLREPYSKHIEDGIFELRVKVGTDITRVLYFFYYDGKIVLTNGFVKKTNKTPRAEIELAKKYRKEYVERCENHEKI